jgi:hypothetical protein
MEEDLTHSVSLTLQWELEVEIREFKILVKRPDESLGLGDAYDLSARRNRDSGFVGYGIVDSLSELQVRLKQMIVDKQAVGYKIKYVNGARFASGSLEGSLEHALVFFFDAVKRLPLRRRIEAVEVVVTVNAGEWAPIW